MTPENQLQILRYLDADPNQRTLAQQLGFSLGKTNYVLKCLMEKGLIKAERFAQNSNKLGYRYVLTPKGLKERINLTEQFIQRKRQEYDELEQELVVIKKLKRTQVEY